MAGVTVDNLAEAALLSSMPDETPEGRSIVDLAQRRYPILPPGLDEGQFIEFTAQTRMSGIDYSGRRIPRAPPARSRRG